MALVHNKLKQARRLMNLTQVELSEQLNWADSSPVSQYERGSKKGVTQDYIDWLLKNNFDLNTLFDDSIPEIQFKGEAPVGEKPDTKIALSDCPRCHEKDQRILELEAQVRILQDTLIQRDIGKQKSA
jgi:transcriptional regulator with XRE-family HTH domain